MEWFILIVSLLICGIIGALIGANKNAEGTGCLIGVLFGPLGLLAALATDNRKMCPNCGGRLNGTPPMCQHCGRSLEWAEPVSASELQHIEDRERVERRRRVNKLFQERQVAAKLRAEKRKQAMSSAINSVIDLIQNTVNGADAGLKRLSGNDKFFHMMLRFVFVTIFLVMVVTVAWMLGLFLRSAIFE